MMPESQASGPDTLNDYFKQYKGYPILTRHQERRSALTMAAARALLFRWPDLAKGDRRRTDEWDMACAQLYRSWDDVNMYCQFHHVAPPPFECLLKDVETVPNTLKEDAPSFLETYLSRLGWGQGDSDQLLEEDEEEALKTGDIHKLSHALFTVMEALIALPPVLRPLFGRSLRGVGAKLPEWEETIRQLRAIPDEELSAHRQWLQDRFNIASELLILSNVRFALTQGRRYLGQGLDEEDCSGYAVLALVEVVKTKYDPSHGTRVTTYVRKPVRQGVEEGVRHGRTIWHPAQVKEEIRELNDVVVRLQEELGHLPTNEEIALAMGRKVDAVERIKRASMHRVSSLNAQVGFDDDDGGKLEDICVYEEVDPEIRAYQLALRDTITEVLRSLPEREAEIIKLRHGLNHDPPYTLEEIARIYGITRERIRQLEAQGEAKVIRQIATRFPDLLPPNMKPDFAFTYADRHEAWLPMKRQAQKAKEGA